MKKDKVGMTSIIMMKEMVKTKSSFTKSRQKIEHELEQFSATREEFGIYEDEGQVYGTV